MYLDETFLFFSLGVKQLFILCAVSYRETLSWWEGLLEKRATKEKQSVNAPRWFHCTKIYAYDSRYLLLLDLIVISFRVTEEPKVHKEKRGLKVKRVHQESRWI